MLDIPATMQRSQSLFGAIVFTSLLTLVHPATDSSRSERIYLAGGCYWGVEAVFEHVRGVRSVVSGFAVPVNDTAGPGPRLRHTSYAETVRIDYDPEKISYAQLLEIFFLVAHDPTQLDQQGPDVGPQYRSLVFVSNADQRKEVEDYLSELRAKRTFPGPIVTEIAGLQKFVAAPEDQQDYVVHNNDTQYVRAHDIPMLVDLQRRYPTLYH
jgi:peptide-methionine (S)-S-oxide reductase